MDLWCVLQAYKVHPGKICGVLTSQGVLMAIPLVLPDSAVSPFKFYRDAAIHEGILHDKKIYRLRSAFDASQSGKSFQVAKQLAEQTKVVLTTGRSNHRVWVEVV